MPQRLIEASLKRAEPERAVAEAPAASLPVAASIIQPALQAFGAAMRQAIAEERKPARFDGEPTAIGQALATATPVAAPLTPSSPALDTADRRWPHAMAEQIERLRDAANESSTRIRLLPDALGPVDVAVRREGEHVHVHFTAAQADTRQLLADAQPRLADAAEARGLKLGRTDVSAGDPSGDERGQQRPATPHQFSSRPTPARAPRAVEADASDTRIA